MSIHGAQTFTHEHVFLGKSHDENTRRTILVVGLTAVMMIGEIIAGIAYNSMALLADGVHMATHAGALAVAAGAYAFAKRHARDPRFTFGTGKVGDLAGFASALALGLIALAIVAEAIGRLFTPLPVRFMEATAVAVLGLVVNIASAFMLGGGHSHGSSGEHKAHNSHSHHDHDHDHDHDNHRHAPQGGDNNMRSALAHVIADALTSVLAIAALLAGRFLGWVWLDPIIAIVGAVVIASWSWTLMRDSATVLLDLSDGRLETEVRATIDASKIAITDLHVWRVGPEAWAAIVSYSGDADELAMRERLSGIRGLAHLTIEARPAVAARSA